MAVAVVGVMRVVVASVRGWGRGHVAVTRYYGLRKLCVISVFFSSDKKEGLVFKEKFEANNCMTTKANCPIIEFA